MSESDIPDIAKLTYLRFLLQGVESQCVAGMPLISENYQATVDILKSRFGRPEQIVFCHVQALLALGTTEFKTLQELQDVIQVHIRSLKALGVGGATNVRSDLDTINPLQAATGCALGMGDTGPWQGEWSRLPY